MTCLIACSRCGEGFDLDEAGAGAIYMRFPERIPLCASCIDEIVCAAACAENATTEPVNFLHRFDDVIGRVVRV